MQNLRFCSSGLCLGRRSLRPVAFASRRSLGGSRLRKMTSNDYSTWNADQLLERVKSLERQLEIANAELRKARLRPPSPAEKPSRRFDPSQYSTRHIALKFAYLGQKYNGFEHHKNNKTPLQTIEEVLWDALLRARLIWPRSGVEREVDWEGCDYSKCGRTDKGVSAFGQVIGVRVRSNRPLRSRAKTPMETESISTLDDATSGKTEHPSVGDASSESELILDMPMDDVSGDSIRESEDDFDDIRDEIPYISILNRILPPEIRVLAWCPAPPDFSARFSCKERRYRYFFTQPAFSPTPGPIAARNGEKGDMAAGISRDGWFDIDAMKAAAKKYEGLHDFRNFCKVDASKQIENFNRRIFFSEIRELDPAEEPAAYVAGREFARTGELIGNGPLHTSQHTPKVYQFVLHGSAFLWHQVRHMVAVLFLIGQGLESSSVIDDLLDIHKTPRKPVYNMADDAPLVLWDCIFPQLGLDMPTESCEDVLPWIWIGGSPRNNSAESIRDKFGPRGVVNDLWKVWRKHKIDEILAGSLLNLASKAGGKGPELHLASLGKGPKGNDQLFLGGNTSENKGLYVPLLKRSSLDPPDVVNARYRARKANISGGQVSEMVE